MAHRTLKPLCKYLYSSYIRVQLLLPWFRSAFVIVTNLRTAARPPSSSSVGTRGADALPAVAMLCCGDATVAVLLLCCCCAVFRVLLRCCAVYTLSFHPPKGHFYIGALRADAITAFFSVTTSPSWLRGTTFTP